MPLQWQRRHCCRFGSPDDLGQRLRSQATLYRERLQRYIQQWTGVGADVAKALNVPLSPSFAGGTNLRGVGPTGQGIFRDDRQPGIANSALWARLVAVRLFRLRPWPLHRH